ncbi:MAG: electron transfer flavoprotein subunit beta/FixA family protein [candidate division KSB1 bacterium]|nr:electron transfer flavoprotein subunit beta/FixA family protein [candidate division KSB1 bacterium]MDZ7274066.1 electron transfer flavoprotein subunit beta/FixA family protein [candidate division KSB1 bacterium]MDZ7287888.1 electron transfer flavoprotein subunit beta/FixA family protein [candidate division KSB1 bacterium]MDZ7296666.1 electron transfer flavoprotein subunit beta/FixA family protein [candidate division KSB1 bacterium]MDZ7307283.1 electron transfer flavoprotein subunit beta/FixA
MNILVPIKQVPDLVEELEINEEGTDLNRDAVKYKINEFDDHALEEALQLKAEVGGTVTVLALDGDETDKMLYTAIAKGADKGVKVTGDFAGGVTSHVAAKAMANAISTLPHDLILTGVQAVDDRDGQMAVLLANYLGVPHVSVVTGVKVDGGRAIVHKEYAGGVMAEFEVDLPAVLGIQAARETPRYVAVSRVRQVQKEATLEEVEAGDTAVAAGSSVRRMMKPEKGSRAEMIEGSPEEIADKIVALMKEKGLKK